MNLQKQINELTKGCGDEIYKDIGGFPNCCGDDDGDEIYLCDKCKSKSQGLLIGLKELKKVVDEEIEWIKNKLEHFYIRDYFTNEIDEEWGSDNHMLILNVEEMKKNLTTKSEKLSKQIKELEEMK